FRNSLSLRERVGVRAPGVSISLGHHPTPSNNKFIKSALVPKSRVGMPSWPLRGPPPPHEDGRRRASKAAFRGGGWERAPRACSDGSRAYRRLRGSVRFGGVCRAKAPCL